MAISGRAGGSERVNSLPMTNHAYSMEPEPIAAQGANPTKDVIIAN